MTKIYRHTNQYFTVIVRDSVGYRLMESLRRMTVLLYTVVINNLSSFSVYLVYSLFLLLISLTEFLLMRNHLISYD